VTDTRYQAPRTRVSSTPHLTPQTTDEVVLVLDLLDPLDSTITGFFCLSWLNLIYLFINFSTFINHFLCAHDGFFCIEKQFQTFLINLFFFF
jgi:hypothetical protein